jgi:two-component system, chemotaxis family, protein-glutamate methylesterase/glutaminase
MIRVLLVDDSVTVRKTVAAHLRAAGVAVVGEAADGREGVALTHRLRPNVVLMDVVMPGMDGLDATRQIMKEIPTPVVILSGYAGQRETFKTYDALASGALEVCAKPTTNDQEGDADWGQILLTVRAAAQASVFRQQWPHAGSPKQSQADISTALAGNRREQPQRRIVVIGASTGGPAAVKYLLKSLPMDFPLPILIAIHCNKRLSASVAHWFDGHCELHVRDAQDGQRVPNVPGTVLTAPPGRNLTIRGGSVILGDTTDNPGCAPSVNELFKSAANNYGNGTIGVLLTGMGADGAAGLKHIHDCGGFTIAQDEATSVVYGMPAAAIQLEAVEHGTALDQIPELLNRLTQSKYQACQSPGKSS